MQIFSGISNGVKISIAPFYKARSFKEYLWEYRVYIHNLRDKKIQIIGREFVIVGSNGIVNKIEGDGIVGEKPIVDSGAHYMYVSATPLNSSSGIMYGNYIVSSGDSVFKIAIPSFSLDSHSKNIRV
jgi:ApaG protein